MSELNLYERTIQLMLDPPVQVARACRDLQLSERWWFRVVSGSIKDPGVKRMQRLHDYLTEKSRQNEAAA